MNYTAKSRDRIYEEYIKNRDFINNSLEEECRNENSPLHQVFFVCVGFLYFCLYHNLWLDMFYYQKARIENDALKTSLQTTERKK